MDLESRISRWSLSDLVLNTIASLTAAVSFHSQHTVPVRTYPKHYVYPVKKSKVTEMISTMLASDRFARVNTKRSLRFGFADFVRTNTETWVAFGRKQTYNSRTNE